MTFDSVGPEYSALHEHIEGAGRHYESFPEPQAPLEVEEFSLEASVKHRVTELAGKARSYVQRLLEGLHSTRLLQDESSSTYSGLSSTSSRLEDPIFYNPVCYYLPTILDGNSCSWSGFCAVPRVG